jgi:hypothetical protein
LVHFSGFGVIYHEKSGNPAPSEGSNSNKWGQRKNSEIEIQLKTLANSRIITFTATTLV